MFELRHIKGTELRASKDGKQIFGYAATFNVNAQLPGFRECIRSGAFTRAVRNKQDVVCLFNHDANKVLGRTTSGTLRLKQDGKGLYYTCDLPDTEAGRDMHISISRGDINGCSFAFRMVENGQRRSEGRTEDGAFFVQREITGCDLLDVSPVTNPAYSGTEVDARTAAIPAELRARVDALNFGREIGHTPDDGKKIVLASRRQQEAQRKFLNSPASKRFRDQLDAITAIAEDVKRRKQMLADILND